MTLKLDRFPKSETHYFSIGLTFIYIKKRGSSFILNIASNPVKNIIMLETSVKLTKLFYVLLLSDNGCFFFFSSISGMFLHM